MSEQKFFVGGRNLSFSSFCVKINHHKQAPKLSLNLGANRGYSFFVSGKN